MPIYRLNLDRGTMLHLGAGTVLLLLVVFFSGTLLGYTLSGGPLGSPTEEDVARRVAHAVDDTVCPDPDQPVTTVQRAERRSEERRPLALSSLPWGAWAAEEATSRAPLAPRMAPEPEFSSLEEPGLELQHRLQAAPQHRLEATPQHGLAAAPQHGPWPAPSEEAATAADDPFPIPHGRYAVQVGAFGVRENAHALASDLRARGYEPLIVTARNRRGDWLEHVHLSIHADEASARAMAEDFARIERLNAVVVPALPPEVRR